MVEAEIKYWEENQDELWGAINTEYWKKIEDWDYSVSKTNTFIVSYNKFVYLSLYYIYNLILLNKSNIKF